MRLWYLLSMEIVHYNYSATIHLVEQIYDFKFSLNCKKSCSDFLATGVKRKSKCASIRFKFMHLTYKNI